VRCDEFFSLSYIVPAMPANWMDTPVSHRDNPAAWAGAPSPPLTKRQRRATWLSGICSGHSSSASAWSQPQTYPAPWRRLLMLSVEGCQAEATPEYGFVFIRREAERRLPMLTPQDPTDTAV
jgi:hypothetical protein